MGLGKEPYRSYEKYWDSYTLVPRQSGFYGEPFKAERGATQGDIISPTIFNIIVDAVIRVWTKQRETETISVIFYADDGRLAGSNHQAIQQGMDDMKELFATVGLQMSESKTKAMISTGNDNYHRLSDEAYKRRMTGKGTSHREKMAEKVVCDKCNEMVTRQYLWTHMELKHQVTKNVILHSELLSCQDYKPKHFTVTGMPCHDSKGKCPACLCTIKSRHGMRRHFGWRHEEDTVEIEGEGLLPRCELCGLHTKDIAKHQGSKDCTRLQEKKRKKEEDIERRKTTTKPFTINGKEIEWVDHFKYLGRWISKNDSDQKAISENIGKARKRWSTFSRVLIREGATFKTMGIFYKTIIMTVLLYGAETWSLSQKQLSLLKSFHNQCARAITSRKANQDEEGNWKWPSITETLEMIGLKPINEYIQA